MTSSDGKKPAKRIVNSIAGHAEEHKRLALGAVRITSKLKLEAADF